MGAYFHGIGKDVICLFWTRILFFFIHEMTALEIDINLGIFCIHQCIGVRGVKMPHFRFPVTQSHSLLRMTTGSDQTWTHICLSVTWANHDQ